MPNWKMIKHFLPAQQQRNPSSKEASPWFLEIEKLIRHISRKDIGLY